MSTLNGALPELQTAYDALDRYARSIGISIGVANFGGIRTEADTTKIMQYRVDDYAAARNAGTIRPDTTLQQFRAIAPFGSSYHNYGAAFDVEIRARPSSMTIATALAKLGAYAPNVGLRWGGNFRSANAPNGDQPHFELPITLAQAQARYRAYASASSSSAGDIFGFDLSKFLPGTTPTSDQIEATLTVPDVPPYYLPVDESGDAQLATVPPESSTTPLIVIGFVVAGVIVWTLRRKLS